MKKYIVCADLCGYAEVEAESEDEAWDKAKALPFSAFDVSDTVYDIVFVDEEDV